MDRESAWARVRRNWPVRIGGAVLAALFAKAVMGDAAEAVNYAGPAVNPDQYADGSKWLGMLAEGLGGFVLPIAFGVMNDLTGVWTSCFMLLFALVGTALLWMHFAIRIMERAELPGLETLPELPEMIELHPPAPMAGAPASRPRAAPLGQPQRAG